MTEVPEHLLARSRARRQAIGQGGGEAAPEQATEGAAPSAAVEPAGQPAAPAGPAPAAAPTPAKAPAPPAPPPAPPKRPEVVAAENRKKIPWWAVPAAAALPVWAAIYAFTLEPPTEESLVASEGAAIYSACAGCHGADGSGGVGPQLSGGAVLETFPDFQDHIRWVELGSDGWKAEVGPTYGATEKPATTGMPGWAGTLSPEEIALVVRYEREVLAGGECEPELAEMTGEPCE